MPTPTTEDHPPREAAGAGFFGRVTSLIAAKLAYLHARLELAGLEGKEAAVHLAIIVALAVIALVAVIFGYFLLVIALVFVVALAFGGGNAWIWVLFGAAVLHLLIAAGLAFVAKMRLAAPLFPLTMEEFKKDQEWLKSIAKPS